MHIQKNKLFTIQQKGLEQPSLTGLFTNTEHMSPASNNTRLTVYRDNVPIFIMEAVFGEVIKYLDEHFNFKVHSLIDES